MKEITLHKQWVIKAPMRGLFVGALVFGALGHVLALRYPRGSNQGVLREPGTLRFLGLSCWMISVTCLIFMSMGLGTTALYLVMALPWMLLTWSSISDSTATFLLCVSGGLSMMASSAGWVYAMRGIRRYVAAE